MKSVLSLLLLSAQAWAQTKGVLPEGALPDLPSASLAVPVDGGGASLSAPLALDPVSAAPLSTLPSLGSLEPAAPAPVSASPMSAARTERAAVTQALQGVRIGEASAGDARGLGERLQAILERGPASASLPGLAAAADDDASLPDPHGAPDSANRLLERVRDERLRVQLEQKIYQDPLTGLPKRSWLEDRLEEVVSRKSVVMIVDLDHFKTKVNDAHGHSVGDIALSELGAIIRQHETRGRVSARWGGEEFVLVDEAGPADALRAAERLRADVEARLGPAVREAARRRLGKEVDIGKLTISIGLSPIVRGEASAHGAWIASLALADRLLYEAKDAGRNKVKFADAAVWARARSERPWLGRGAAASRPYGDRESVLSGRIRWAGGKPGRSVDQLLASITNRDLRANLEKKIYTDPLTGAYNRAHLNDHLSDLVARNRTVIAFDVDFFKKVNDTYGHSKGDDVLAALVALMKARFGAPVYRMGGEEFLALVPDDEHGAFLRAEDFRRRIEAELGPAVGLAKVTASIGVSELPASGEADKRFGAAVEAADEGLYESKHAGRNRVTLKRAR